MAMDLKYDDLQWTKQHPLNWYLKDWMNWFHSVAIDYGLKDISRILQRYQTVACPALLQWSWSDFCHLDPIHGRTFHFSLKQLLAVFGNFEIPPHSESVEEDDGTNYPFLHFNQHPSQASLLDLSILYLGEGSCSSEDFDDLRLETGQLTFRSTAIQNDFSTPIPETDFVDFSCSSQASFSENKDLDSEGYQSACNSVSGDFYSSQSWGFMEFPQVPSIPSPEPVVNSKLTKRKPRGQLAPLKQPDSESGSSCNEASTFDGVALGRTRRSCTLPTMVPVPEVPPLVSNRHENHNFVKKSSVQGSISRQQVAALDGLNKHLWKFLLGMIRNPVYSDVIVWENQSQGQFQILDGDRLATLWGKKKGNRSMDYEKMSRAIRHYYKKKVIVSVPKQQMVYKFGPKSTFKTKKSTLE